MARPNILYLHSHDTGRFIQPYGHAIPTPHLQRLAEEGVLFRQAYSAAPTCSASRAALVTGRYPHANGMLGLAHRGFSLNDYRQHIIHTLRRSGYTSALSGIQHIDHLPGRPYGARIGYDRILSDGREGEGKPVSAEDAAARFLRGNPPEPFLLSVGFFETHREYPEPDAEAESKYTLPPPPLPDTPETRRDMACFKASARRLDAKMGVVLEALREAALEQQTLVVCTTDHGIAFPRMKCHLTDAGIGVMLILRGPPPFAGGRVVDALVSHVDIVPTLCDWLGIDPPDGLHGLSLMPFLRGEAGEVRDEIFAEVTYHAAYEPQRCVRTRRWKYIRRFDDRTRPVLPNCDDGPSKTLWMNGGWNRRSPADEGLYDLVFDPGEADNLAGDPTHAAVLAEMRARLDRWMRDTGDPLHRGPVPLPAGARANDPDGVSPQEP